jgi:hypothetical protein
MVLGFELRVLHLLYHLSHTSSPFCSGYFGDRVLCSAQAFLELQSYFSFPPWQGWQACTTKPSFFFFIQMESHKHFCLGWPWMAILPISASCTAGMIDTHHLTQLLDDMGVSQTFCLEPWFFFPILASQVARITSMGHWLSVLHLLISNYKVINFFCFYSR